MPNEWLVAAMMGLLIVLTGCQSERAHASSTIMVMDTQADRYTVTLYAQSNDFLFAVHDAVPDAKSAELALQIKSPEHTQLLELIAHASSDIAAKAAAQAMLDLVIEQFRPAAPPNIRIVSHVELIDE